MPEVRYIGVDRVRRVSRKPGGRVVVTFRRRPDGSRRPPVDFATLDDYLGAVRREFVPGGQDRRSSA